MAIVLTVRNAAEGFTVGTCSAKCYDAEPGSRCRCVCDGLNHGVGETKALHNVKAQRTEWEKTGRVAVDLDPRSAQEVLEFLK